MSPSLRDLQRRFAASLLAGNDDPHTAPYRNTVRANYRSALAATYAVVCELTGTPFFHAAVDAFVAQHPSSGGDLNVYGDAFPDFLATYPHARDLAYLTDVARLEWALDEAVRAQDYEPDPEAALAALAEVPGDRMAQQRFVLDPSCRFVRSPYPVMRIWQVHQGDGERSVNLDEGPDHLAIRRERDVPVVMRIPPADFAFLTALASGQDLGAAVQAALASGDDFDLADALRTSIADGTLAGVRQS